MNYDAIREKAIEFMLARNWKQKTGKLKQFNQSLFDHSLVVLDAMIALLPLFKGTFLPALSDEEEQVLLAGVIAHDVGKELDDWQGYVHGQRGFLSDVNRQLAEEAIPQLASLLGFGGVEETITGVLMHMSHERTTAKVMDRVLFGEHSNERWKTLGDIIAEVDNLGSAKGLFEGLRCLEERSCFSRHVRSAYHLIQLRGVSTTLLHRAAIDSFFENGWNPVLHYSNGTIYATSATASDTEPTVDDLSAKLTKLVGDATGKSFANAVVTTDFRASPLPKPDLFDYRELKQYLEVASRRVRRKTSDAVERKTVISYLNNKGVTEEPSEGIVQLQAARIGAAQPEICIFKFLKAALDQDLLGDEVIPEAKTVYAAFAEGGGKKKAPQVTPQSVARAEYDKVFGEGAYAQLQSTSTLMPARDMAATVDRFWSLDGARFGLEVSQVEHLLDHARREATLIDALVQIADKVYASLPEHNRPTRATSEVIAERFMHDLIHPSPQFFATELVEQQLRAYAATKINARRDKGAHLCPICNSTFEGGTVAKADFLANPESHTNRAASHGKPGYIVICDACKFERFLQQLLLGEKVEEIIVMVPRMNIGHGNGDILRQKATRIWEAALNRMTDANPDPDQHLSLGITFNLARKLADVDVFRLSPTEIVELMTYESSKETKKKHRKELEDKLKQLYDVDELTVAVLNDNWGTDYATANEALQALIANKVTDDDARKVRAAAFRLKPQLHIACQTPHLILVPLANPISMGDESDTNAGIRELYVTLLLGLALDCSVAVMRAGEVITFEGGLSRRCEK